MSLRTYHSKRKFNQTKEPRGDTGKKGPFLKGLFVVQKHQASRLHFDFRLESEGVLKSWAVPKGIPQPGEKHLAMMVEDHPFEYKDFEGIIPKGNYGAGTVMVWDQGEFEILDGKSVAEGIEKGGLHFRLYGKKIVDDFTLIHLKKARKKNSWIIIRKKNKDSGGKEDLDELSVVSGRSMEEIGQDKPIRTLENTKGAMKAEVPDFVKPMLATLVEKPFSREGWIFENKWDGYRIIAIKNKENINLFSRNKRNFNKTFSSIAESLKAVRGSYVFDGEVVVLDKEGHPDFQFLQNYLDSGEGILVYYVFDILYCNGYDIKNVQLNDRKNILSKIKFPNGIRISQYIKRFGEELFTAVTAHGMEGIIGKNDSSVYHDGIRSPDWLKVKSMSRQEFVIGGFTNPRGSRKKIGALVLGVYEKEELIYVGHVGGGMNESDLRILWEKLSPIVTDVSPFKKIPKTNMPVKWVYPKIVCEVKFFQWTSEGIMRQPVYLGLREDKDPIEVRREVPLKVSDRKIYNIEKVDEYIEHGVHITNSGKVLFPEDGYTKRNLIDYYKDISKIILPHLKDRPLSLNRFPNGIYGKSFFQKDMKNAPDWVKTVDIFSESENRTLHYILCQDKESLLYIANLASIEINPWNSRIGSLDNPDYMVFDIDPPDASLFKNVIAVALKTKEILEKVGAVSYCKTSGLKGLHIYVPLNKKYEYEQVREFSFLINMIVHSKLPDITSLERNPAKREGKIYLDYLQNKKGQTMAAPYSVRPRSGATVSTPLNWEEVNENLNPLDFTIKTIKDRVNIIGDIWMSTSNNNFDMHESLSNIERLKFSLK